MEAEQEYFRLVLMPVLGSRKSRSQRRVGHNSAISRTG